MSKNSTGTGTTYRSRAAARALTRRRFSTLGTAVLVVLGAAFVAVLLHPPLLNWWLS